MAKKGEYITFKNYGRKIKLPFMIFANFESALVPEDNAKQNPEEPYTSKYQKHIPCSYDFKLLCADDKFIQPFKSYLGEDAVYNFYNKMIKESQYCSNLIKKHFSKELRINKEHNEDFENFTKCCICANF